jgi:hypothetical protein
MAETSLISIGASASLPILSGDTDLCVALEEMEDMAGHCVWMDDFYPVNIPQKRLIESLLWHLHSESVCCAVSGLFPAYQAAGFKEILFTGLYIARCGMPDSKTARLLLFQNGTGPKYFTLRNLKSPLYRLMYLEFMRSRMATRRIQSMVSLSLSIRGAPVVLGQI